MIKVLKICSFVLISTISFISGFAHSADAPNVAIKLSKDEKAWITKHPEIICGIDVAYPPYEYVDNEGNYKGIAAEYLQILEESLGVRFKPTVNLTWKEVIEKSKLGELDALSCLMVTPERREYLDFTESYISVPLVVIMREDAPFISGLDDFEIMDLTIASTFGYASQEFIDTDYRNIRSLIVETPEKGLKMVSTGNVDGYLINLATSTYFIRRLGLTNLKIAYTTSYVANLCMAVPKGNKIVVGILQKGLKAISPDIRDKIMNKWIAVKYEAKIDYKIALRILAVALILILAIVFWNRSMAREIKRRKVVEAALRESSESLEAANQRMRKDLEAAAKVQEALLPQSPPKTDRARFVWKYQPCDELAGDSLNVFQIDDRHVAMYVLDVSGHGVPASLLSVTITRSLSSDLNINSFLVGSDSKKKGLVLARPSEVAARLNRAYPMDPKTLLYFTIIYGILDTHTGDLNYVCAGHPPPIICQANGDTKKLEGKGVPIGMLEEAEYDDMHVKLMPGDRVYFYSDELYEEKNPQGEGFSEERLLESIKKVKDMSIDESIAGLIEDLIAWKGHKKLRDDLSIVVCEIRRSKGFTIFRK